jgi:hypothetical protein
MKRFTEEETRNAVLGIPMTDGEFEGLAEALVTGQTKKIEDSHLFQGRTGRVKETSWSPEVLYTVIRVRLESLLDPRYGPDAQGGIILLWRKGRATILGFLAIGKIIIGLSVYKEQSFRLMRWLKDLKEGKSVYFYFGSSESPFPVLVEEGTQMFQKLGESETEDIGSIVQEIWSQILTD